MKGFTPEQLEVIERWLRRNDEPWIAAARKAMNGDWADLNERVDLLSKPGAPRIVF